MAAPLDDDATRVPDPVIVVEVASPSTQAVDSREPSSKGISESCFGSALPAGQTPRREPSSIMSAVDDGSIRTSIVREGKLDLDPPGMSLRT